MENGESRIRSSDVSMEYSTFFYCRIEWENQSYVKIGLGCSLGSYIFNSA